MSVLRALFGGWLAATLVACSPEPAVPPIAYEPVAPADAPLRFAIHPLHNPGLLLEAYGDLASVLSAASPGRPLKVEASRSYASFEDKIRRREPEVLLPNPWQTLLALQNGYRVIAMAGDPDDFRGLILVRRDGPVHTTADLRGHTVAYPAPTAVAAALLPQWFLHTQGLAVDRDVRSVYVGSQESSILQVWSGQVVAAATWPPPWQAFQRSNPEKAAALQVKWQTPALPSNSVMVRDDLPDELVQRLRDRLYTMHLRPEGAAALAKARTARFWPADERTYAPVRRFIDDFEREVRPLREPEPVAHAAR